MKESVIKHLDEGHFIIIRDWQLIACEGNQCAAALLSFFEHWHNWKIGLQQKNRQSNDVAEIHGDPRILDESLWQFHNNEDLEKGILIFKRSTISKAIEYLEKKGFIKVGSNPNPRYKFDRTRWFLLCPEAINACIAKIADRPSKNSTSSAKNSTPSVEIRPPQTRISTPEAKNRPAIYIDTCIDTLIETITEEKKQVATQPGAKPRRADVAEPASARLPSAVEKLTAAWTKAYTDWHPNQTRPADAEDWGKNAKRIETLAKALGWLPVPDYLERLAGIYLQQHGERKTFADLCARFSDLEVADTFEFDHPATLPEAIVLNAAGYPCNLNETPKRAIPWTEMLEIRHASEELKTRLNGYGLDWLKSHGLTSRDLLSHVYGERHGRRLRPASVPFQYDLLIRQRRQEGRLTEDEYQHLGGIKDDGLNEPGTARRFEGTQQRTGKPGIAERYRRALSSPVPPEWGGTPDSASSTAGEAGTVSRTSQGDRPDARRLSPGSSD